MDSQLSQSTEKIQEHDKDVNIKIKKILVPLDGSSYSLRAAKYAIEVAKLQRAQIVCIHILDRIPYGFEFTGSCIEDYLQNVENQSNIWFNQVIQMANNQGINDVKTAFFRDIRSIVDAIVNYASNNTIDLIVLGTRGRTGLQRALMGSIATGVSQHAHCPVMLIK
ncbi:MAG: universal stress protein [Candidatus Nitrosocosmicus sp.]